VTEGRSSAAASSRLLPGGHPAAERARREAGTFGFDDYFRVGLPLTVAMLLLGSGWLWLVG
jgi:hypothetical protein